MTQFWLYLHFLGLVFLAAGVGVANVSGFMMSKAESMSVLAMWSRINHKVEHLATLPGALLLLVAGTVLVDREGYDYGAPWISAAYALWIVAVFLGAGVLGRRARRIHAAAAEQAAAGNETDAAIFGMARSPVGPIVGNLLNLIILVFLYLMVVKPGS
jgi:uncharacterized membrane protein